MNIAFEKPSLWQRVKPVMAGFDWPLLLIVMSLCAIGLGAMYSAGYDHGTRFIDQSRNMALALTQDSGSTFRCSARTRAETVEA